MAVMDEFKKEREAMKNGTPKEKLAYFWYYYKWYVIVGIAVVVFLVSFIYEMVTQKQQVFNGTFINSWEQDGSQEYMQGFVDANGIDTDKYDVYIDTSIFISDSSMDETSMNSAQKLMVYMAANEIDVIASDLITFVNYANSNSFCDLRDVLSPEEIKKYEPYFYYIDQSAVDKKDAAIDAMDESYVPNFPDPTKPEEMVEPIPVGLFVDSNLSFHDAYLFSDKTVIMGVVVSSHRQGTAVDFINYVFE